MPREIKLIKKNLSIYFLAKFFCTRL